MTTTREYIVELIFDENKQMTVSSSVWALWNEIKFEAVQKVNAVELDNGDYLLTLKD